MVGVLRLGGISDVPRGRLAVLLQAQKHKRKHTAWVVLHAYWALGSLQCQPLDNSSPVLAAGPVLQANSCVH
jgi:hypothetical protein